MNISVSKHGAKRVRKRFGVPKKAVERVVNRAFFEGRHHADCNGSLRRYLDKQFLSGGAHANNMRISSGHLWLFHGNTLVTLWSLPSKYQRQFK